MILTWVGSIIQEQHPNGVQAEVSELLVVGQRDTPTECSRGSYHTCGWGEEMWMDGWVGRKGGGRSYQAVS